LTIEFVMLAGPLLFFSKLHRFQCVADYLNFSGATSTAPGFNLPWLSGPTATCRPPTPDGGYHGLGR
jgi:hypothetical protein